MKKCLNCEKIITGHSKNILRCKSCAMKENAKHRDYKGINNPNFGNHILSIINRGKNNPNYKDGHTTYQHFCLDCGKKIHREAKRCRSCFGKTRVGNLSHNFKNGKTKNNKCVDCGTHISYNGIRCKKCANTLEKHPNWQNGKSFEPYNKLFINKLKEEIRQRDNYICQLCNKNQSELRGYHKKFSIHHIDYNKKNCKKKNLITLCLKCHPKTGFNRDYWYAYFRYLMELK